MKSYIKPTIKSFILSTVQIILMLCFIFSFIPLTVYAEDCLWSEWVVDIAPTCQTTGQQHRICLLDSSHPHRDERFLPKIDHHYQMKQSGTGCQKENIYTCKDCGFTYKEHFFDDSAHIYQEKERTPATCTTTGTMEYTCRFCDDAYTKEIPAQSHQYAETEIAPDCLHPGGAKYTCQQCDDSFEEMHLPATGHHYLSQEEQDGSVQTTIYTCQHCGDRYQTEKEETVMTAENIALIAANGSVLLLFTKLINNDITVLKWAKRQKQLLNFSNR